MSNAYKNLKKNPEIMDDNLVGWGTLLEKVSSSKESNTETKDHES